MSLGKHFINNVEDPVERGLKCLLRQNQALRLIELEKVLYRTQSQPKVLLLSGGGSGHEPAHAGYLGEGMLDICVAGQIFASPSASQVLAGLKALKSPRGVLMIVKNYTGDKLNFGLAAQKAKADGINVNAIFVGDDVSVKGNELVGRRGLAGVVFVHKIAGALAAEGATLEEVTQIGQHVADNISTVGVSLDKCSVPNRGKQESLPFEDLEYGMGIHNEPGVRRETIPSLQSVVKGVLDFFKLETTHSKTPVAVMINNLGGLSVLELNVVADEVLGQLSETKLEIRRTFIGTFVTSLDSPGFSITILKLQPDFEKHLNAPSSAPAWPKDLETVRTDGISEQLIRNSEIVNKDFKESNDLFPTDSTLLSTILRSIAMKVTKDEPQITKYDTIAGDGDCGETLLKGVNAVQKEFSKRREGQIALAPVFRDISTTIERSMGGTSGAIYAIFFNAVANSLSTPVSSASIPISLSRSLQDGLTELCQYTSARQGHKTLMDALIPFVETFAKSMDFAMATEVADQGAESTRRLDAMLGRASYVSKEHIEREGGVPDPGAMGVVSVLRGIQDGLKGL